MMLVSIALAALSSVLRYSTVWLSVSTTGWNRVPPATAHTRNAFVKGAYDVTRILLCVAPTLVVRTEWYGYHSVWEASTIHANLPTTNKLHE